MRSSAMDRVYSKGFSALDLVRQDLVVRSNSSENVKERAKEAVRKAFVAAAEAKVELERASES